jgi:transglutaminase-like putative cysteine protease
MAVTSTVADSTKTVFKVSVKDSETGKAVTGNKVALTVSGSRYIGTTDSNGIAEITAKSLATGTYDVLLRFAGTISRYDETEIVVKVDIFRKILVSMSAADAKYTDSKTPFTVSAIDSATKKPVSNVKILFILDGVTYQGVTGSDGVVVITTKHLNEGTYTVTMKVEGTSTYEATSVTQKVKVSKEPDSIALKDLITASKNVKQFIENNEKLPDTVTIAGRTYSAAQFLYFASEAIHKLESKDTSAVAIKAMKTPDSYTPATNLGNLYTYYSVAKRVMEFGDKNALMPTYATSDVGNIGYDGLIYAFARIIAFYGDNSVMPSYVAIKAVSSGIVPDDVNTKNTIKDLTPYLIPSKNCQSDDPEIVALANKLTQGLTSTFAKAEAIYNYVRDYVSYSYYYDTTMVQSELYIPKLETVLIKHI